MDENRIKIEKMLSEYMSDPAEDKVTPMKVKSEELPWVLAAYEVFSDIYGKGVHFVELPGITKSSNGFVRHMLKAIR